MNQPYLEVTFRQGRPLAAYLYLARQAGDRTAHSEKIDDVLVVDRTTDGRPIGIEIIDPGMVTMNGLNDLLKQLNQPPLQQADLAPLHAA